MVVLIVFNYKYIKLSIFNCNNIIDFAKKLCKVKKKAI